MFSLIFQLFWQKKKFMITIWHDLPFLDPISVTTSTVVMRFIAFEPERERQIIF